MRNRTVIFALHFLGLETKAYASKMTLLCAEKSNANGGTVLLKSPYYFSFLLLLLFFLFVLSIGKKIVYSHHFQNVPPYAATPPEGFEPGSIRCRWFEATRPSTYR